MRFMVDNRESKEIANLNDLELMIADDDWEKILPYVLPIVGTFVWPFIWPNIWPIVWPIIWPLKWPSWPMMSLTVERCGNILCQTSEMQSTGIFNDHNVGDLDTIDVIFDNRPDSTRDSSTTIQYIIIGTFSAVVLTIAAVLTGYSYSKRPSSLEMSLPSMPRIPSATVTPRATTSFAEPAQVIISVDLVRN